MAAALVGGIPGAGATKGTVVNINAGGKTRLSGAWHGLFLLIVLLGAGQYAALIPLSVLAGILIPIGLEIIDYKGLRDLRYVPKADAAIMIIVLLVTIFGDLLQAVGVGIVLASVLYMKQSSDLAEAQYSVTPLSTQAEEQLSLKGEAVNGKVYIKHLYGPMFFGFTAYFQELIQSLDRDAKALIIRMERVPFIDQSGLYAMEDALLDLQRKGVSVLLTGVNPQPRDMLQRIYIVPHLVPIEQSFENFEESVAWLKGHIPGESLNPIVLDQ
jgi:SulP family sulfate permease